MSIKSIQDVNHFLESIPMFKKEGKGATDFSLERFKQFCDVLENPQDTFPTIHVGGSNGKGSTCQIIASVYQSAGFRVGVYTSPHILHFSERFTINGQQILDQELIHFFSEYQSLIKSFRLTYFEISTAIAFWWFAHQDVDMGIIEVGLGGRLDATNIITPKVSVITNVTLDHTDILGNTLQQIAREKAGIIKHGVPVVMGNVAEEAVVEIEKIASEKKSEALGITQLQPEWKSGACSLTIDGKQIWIKSTLETPVQAKNIAVAFQVTGVLQAQFAVNKEQFKQGIGQVRNIYPNMARFEKLMPDYKWYFDGAHNIDAIRAMKQMIETIQPVDETILVLSLMKDKINEKMMIEFSEFKKIVYHTLPLGRAASLQDIQEWLPDAQPFPVKQKSPSKILKELNSELVIFAGSFYFYETVRDWLSTFANR